jgi:ketosteroid isomerase-like protein
MAIRTGAALLLAVLAGSAAMSTAQETTAIGDLTAVIATFYAAIEAGDAETRIELLADDVVLMPNHWTMLRGSEEVA